MIEHLIATVGGLKAVIPNNQAKTDVSVMENRSKNEGLMKRDNGLPRSDRFVWRVRSQPHWR
jgi:hypothetical protein